MEGGNRKNQEAKNTPGSHPHRDNPCAHFRVSCLSCFLSRNPHGFVATSTFMDLWNHKVGLEGSGPSSPRQGRGHSLTPERLPAPHAPRALHSSMFPGSYQEMGMLVTLIKNTSNCFPKADSSEQKSEHFKELSTWRNCCSRRRDNFHFFPSGFFSIK